MHSKLVGHQRSKVWQHAMMGACHGSSQAAGREASQSKCHRWRGAGKEIPARGLEDWVGRKSRAAYRAFGSPPLLSLNRHVEDEHGFLQVLDTFGESSAL
eukprot:4899987-Prymnesium_polylepis.1